MVAYFNSSSNKSLISHKIHEFILPERNTEARRFTGSHTCAQLEPSSVVLTTVKAKLRRRSHSTTHQQHPLLCFSYLLFAVIFLKHCNSQNPQKWKLSPQFNRSRISIPPHFSLPLPKGILFLCFQTSSSIFMYQ